MEETYMDNNMRFNQALNSLNNPRRVMEALRTLAAKPCIQQTHDVDQEIGIGIRQGLTLANIAQLSKELS